MVENSAPSGPDLRILIIDDDDLMTQLFPRRLEKALPPLNVAIETAGSPTEGIELLRSKRYDVILCDYNLRAERTGLDVLEEARQLAADSVLILFSGHNASEIPGLKDRELDGFVEKPLRLDDMLPPLVAILEARGKLAAGGPR
ncbi:MAG: response regulator [Thermoplasmatota archaeon]